MKGYAAEREISDSKMDNKMRIMSDEFENADTGEMVTGITIMIDGKLKQMFELMIEKSGKEKSYLEMMHEVLVIGIDEYIKGQGS